MGKSIGIGTGDVYDLRSEVGCILGAGGGLLIQTLQLCQPDRRLILSEPHLGPQPQRAQTRSPLNRSVRVSIVVVGEAAVHKLIIVTDNCTALSHRNVFGILETEATGVSEGTHFLSIDLGQPTLAGILYHLKIMTRSEERRVGKECRARWSWDDYKKKQKCEARTKGSRWRHTR